MSQLLSQYLGPFGGGGGGGATLVAQHVNASNRTDQIPGTFEAATGLTISSAADRMVLAQCNLMAVGATQSLASISATWGTPSRTLGTGTAMSFIGGLNLSGATSSRPRVALFALAAPSTGAGTVQITFGPNDSGATIVDLFELTGADQDVGNIIFNTSAASGSSFTSRAVSLTGVPDNSALIGGWALQSGNYAAEFSADSGSLMTGATGTSSFSDVSAASLYQELTTGGSLSRTVSWSTSTLVAACLAAIPPA